MDTSKVTRVEVINHRDYKGRVYGVGPAVDVKVEVQLQDDGRTLKVFIDRRAAPREPTAEDRRILGTSY